MKKTVYFHIGTMKTGSTSVQEFLLANCELLRNKGVAVITANEENPADSLRTIKLATVVRNPTPEEQEQENQWIAQFAGRLEARPERTFILTDECYWFAAADPNRQARFRFFLETLQAVAEVRVIVYFRRQDLFMMSYHQQNQKRGRLNGKTCRDRVFDNTHDWLHYRAPLEWLIALVGPNNIRVRPFERGQFLGRNLFVDFLRCASLDLTDEFCIPDRPQNPGLPPFLAELMRCLSFFRYSDEERAVLFEASLENQDGRHNVSAQYPTLSPADRHQLMAQFKEDNRWVAGHMLNRSDGILFKEPLPALDEPWEEYRLNPEEVKSFFREGDFLTESIRNRMCRQVLSVCGRRNPLWLRTRDFVRSRARKALGAVGLKSLQKTIRPV